MLPLGFRYTSHFLGKVCRGRLPPIDQYRMRDGRGVYGAPCGGVGGGTVGRGHAGEFCRFQMVPGMYSYE